ncbi:hypothetical protein K432DRAFT_378013 [Lepidopterella palustris CBS 459.81]|uniref:Zn(2)-C6 fungal-type domain-containing protein n=1 Tax=Lepidopterella palustris CBS 459.81 TaxID=1314670 RepID=A0A8E2EJC3_9PEZI|nr:hypothetical protein K432DRAFT_378013 [Lepidopterella palustris CBS 459.81]
MLPSEDRPNRPRVARACDRCKIKKSKCDGNKPCENCKANNALCCVSALKRRSTIYPAGYTELIERQNKYLNMGIVALYRRLLDGKGWDRPVQEAYGVPLVHDILEGLSVKPVDSHGGCIHPDDVGEEYYRSNAPVELPLLLQKPANRTVDEAPAPGRSDTTIVPDGHGLPETDELAAPDFILSSPLLPGMDETGFDVMSVDTSDLNVSPEALSYSPGSSVSSYGSHIEEPWWHNQVIQSDIFGQLPSSVGVYAGEWNMDAYANSTGWYDGTNNEQMQL